MNRNKHFSNLQNFKDLVQIKYELYNGLFLTLPFQGLKDAGVELSFFSKYCRDQMDKNKTPFEVVEGYFKERHKGVKEEEKSNLLFKFLQFIERQIVLFDALEESSFESIEDIHGSGTLNQLFEKVTESSRISEMIKLLETFKIRIVLTAHPTQFYPQAILGIINDLSDAIKSNEIKQINYLLLQLGKTRFTNKKKPTPLTEATNIIWFLWNIFYHVFADIYRELDSFYKENTGKELENPIFELGFLAWGRSRWQPLCYQ